MVTPSDANDIVSLMKDALLDAYTDEGKEHADKNVVIRYIAGVVDYSRSGGMTMSKLVKAFVVQLNRSAKARRNANFSVEQLKEEAHCIKVLDKIPDFQEFIDILNQQCYLLKKRNGIYQCTTTDFSQNA